MPREELLISPTEASDATQTPPTHYVDGHPCVCHHDSKGRPRYVSCLTGKQIGHAGKIITEAAEFAPESPGEAPDAVNAAQEPSPPDWAAVRAFRVLSGGCTVQGEAYYRDDEIPAEALDDTARDRFLRLRAIEPLTE